MKRIISMLLIIIISVILFGCNKKTASDNSVFTNTSSNGSTTNDTQDSSTSIANKDDVWVSIPIRSLKDADTYFHGKGFPEVQLAINEEDISGDVKISTNGTIIKMNVTFMGTNWDAWAVKVDDPTQVINLGLDDAPKNVKIGYRDDHWTVPDLHPEIIIWDNGNNVYICQQTTPRKDSDSYLHVFYFDEKYYEAIENITVSEENPEVWIAEGVFNINGEPHTYKYRVGMTFGEWACSEFNTEGWCIPARYPFVVVNQEDTAYGIPEESMDPGLVIRKVGDDDFYRGKNIDEPEFTQYRKCFTYCLNSWSPLRIEGFAIGIRDSFMYSNFHFGQHIGSEPNKKTFIQAKVASGDIDKIHIYIVNHETDEYTETPEAAVELEVTLREKDNVITGFFTVDDPRGIDPYKPVDFLFTYEDEIVYYAPYYQLQY